MGNIRAVPREDSPEQCFSCQRQTIRLYQVTLRIDTTTAGLKIEMLTWHIGIDNVPIMVNLFITTATAPFASIVPSFVQWLISHGKNLALR
jgi:hypothetical protein